MTVVPVIVPGDIDYSMIVYKGTEHLNGCSVFFSRRRSVLPGIFRLFFIRYDQITRHKIFN